MVRKKNPASDLKMKMYYELLSRGKIYFGKNIYWKKKKRPTLSYELKKNQKTRNWLVKRKKTPFGLLSYNAKSAHY